MARSDVFVDMSVLQRIHSLCGLSRAHFGSLVRSANLQWNVIAVAFRWKSTVCYRFGVA